ncbi:MAG: dihydroorotase [Sphingomonadales bacterium]
MSHIIIKNARIINEGQDFVGEVHIQDQRIAKIDRHVGLASNLRYQEIDAQEAVLMPGVIDAHVHFRDPGLTYKGDIASESRAAVAGGVTSFMDMPNTIPNTVTVEALKEKYKLAATSSVANYSFFMGLTRDNLEEALKVGTEDVCGLTDDGLYFDENHSLLCNNHPYLEKLFARTGHLVALHSEDETIMTENYKRVYAEYGENIPPHYHSIIRDERACLSSTKSLVALADQFQNRLHVLHVSTGAEALLFEAKRPTSEKRITSEVCVHHLVFSTDDYARLGNKIKWNPSVKPHDNPSILLHALVDDRLDMVATDHAPHSWEEKQGIYDRVKPGGPMIQHSLIMLLEFYHDKKITLQQIVSKTSHRVAEVYKIKERGFIKEGYFADLVLVDLNNLWQITQENLRYKCGWSPLVGNRVRSKIRATLVNGKIVFDGTHINGEQAGMRLTFSKIR